MALVAFVFVGAVLLINGLVLLGFVPPRSSVPINLLVGLALAGWWRQAPLALVLGSQAAVVVVYAVLMVRERRCALRPEPTVHTGPLPVTASA